MKKLCKIVLIPVLTVPFSLLWVVTAFWLVCSAMGCSPVNRLVYPGSLHAMPDAACGHEQQHITLKTPDGAQLAGWFFNRGAGKPLVMMFGGNNMNVGSFTDIAAADSGRSYLLLNYRGYGDSKGTPNQRDIVRDAVYALELKQAELGNPPVIIVGYSIGTGVACQVASSGMVVPAKLILICPFDSLTSVATGFVPLLPHLLLSDSYDSVAAVSRLYRPFPISILRAQFDEVIAPKHTDRLIEEITKKREQSPAVFTFPAGHNNIFSAPGFNETLRQQMELTR
ncbi:MAG: alpha/beta hydrolase [Akkermansia sp.]